MTASRLARVSRAVATIAPAAIACFGCAADAGSGGGTVVRDSAGIAIVESAAPAWTAAESWTVDSAPALDLGVVNGPSELAFAGIREVIALPDGGLLVAQRTELRVFSAAGEHVRTLGGAGDGPGEFGFIGSVAVCDGRIYAADFLTGRLTAFRLDGELEATTTLARSDYATSRSLAGCAAGDLIFGVPFSRPPRETPRITRPGYGLVKSRSGGTAEDTIASLAGHENYDGLMVPFGRETVYAVGDSVLYVGDTGRSEVRVLGLDGAVRRISRLPAEPAPVTSRDIERIRAQYLDVPASIADTEIRPRLDALEMPATMPFFERILAAPDGTIWLAPYYPFDEGEARDWRVIAPDGTWLGVVTIPSGLDVHAVTRDFLIGVWRDEYDVEHVRKHRIRMPTAE